VFIYSYVKNCINSCDLVTTLTNQNTIQEETKSRLKSGNAYKIFCLQFAIQKCKD